MLEMYQNMDHYTQAVAFRMDSNSILLTLSGLLSRPGNFKISSTFLDSGFLSTRGVGGGWRGTDGAEMGILSSG